MKRHWSTRLFGASLALWFGLAMVGPEVHQCPVHDVASVPTAAAHAAGHASHDAPQGHPHCTCPQACCPIGVGPVLPAASVRWSGSAAEIPDAGPAMHRVILPSAPRYLLPFALATPPALA